MRVVSGQYEQDTQATFLRSNNVYYNYIMLWARNEHSEIIKEMFHHVSIGDNKATWSHSS